MLLFLNISEQVNRFLEVCSEIALLYEGEKELNPVEESQCAQSGKLWYLLYNQSSITMSARKDKQSCKGLEQYYSESKRTVMIGLIPTALEQLDELTVEFHLFWFKLIERIAGWMVVVGKPRFRTVSSMDKHDET